MAIELSKGALSNALAFVKAFPQGPNPIHYKIDTFKKYSILSGGSEMGGFQYKIKSSGAGGESCIVDGDLFYKIASKAPNGVVTFAFNDKNIHMESGRYVADIATITSPFVYDYDSKPSEYIPCQFLASAIDQVSWAVDKSKSLTNTALALNCISLNSNGEGTTIVATDRNVMGVTKYNTVLPFGGLIPNEFIGVIRKFLGSDSIEIGMAGNIIVFKDENKKLFINKVVTPYIDYNIILSAVSNPKLKIELADIELIASIKRVGLLKKEDFNPINIRFNEEGIHIRSAGEESQIEETLEFVYSDEPISFTVDAGSILNAMLFAGEPVVLEYIEDKKPVVISNGECYKCIITQVPM